MCSAGRLGHEGNGRMRRAFEQAKQGNYRLALLDVGQNCGAGLGRQRTSGAVASNIHAMELPLCAVGIRQCPVERRLDQASHCGQPQTPPCSE
jgi:hypothetical protein